MFAYTNKDVNALNEDLRPVRRERGELSGPDVRFETKHGAAMFAIGDRVQFTDTDKRREIYNGNVGTLTGIDPRSGLFTRPSMDRRAGREVVWSATTSTVSGTAMPARSTKVRARPWTTPTSITRTTGGPRRATWR